jgi:hypothetical protein
MLPAFVGEVWFLDDAQALRRYDPRRYGPEPGEWSIPTPLTYVVTRPRDVALTAWVAKLRAAGAPIAAAPELGRDDLAVYVLTRP